MKIAVVGSTSRTGLPLLREGVRRGYEMTALTRRPERLAGVQGLAAVVVGDGRDAQHLAKAFRGQDAVISIVGGSDLRPTTTARDVARAEVEAMAQAGVRRIVAVGASAVEGNHPVGAVHLIHLLLHNHYADLLQMEATYARSGLAWTSVRPPRLTNGRATGRTRRLAGKHDFDRGPYTISRADLAALLLDLATSQEGAGDVMLVSRARSSGKAGEPASSRPAPHQPA